MARVFITRSIPECGVEALRAAGHSVTVNEGENPLSSEELFGPFGQYDAVVCRLTDPVTRAVLERGAGRLRVLSSFAAGVDNIDVAAASELAIPVTNTPGALTDATADLAFALLLNLTRHVVPADRYVRQGRFRGWEALGFRGMELSGKTLGLLGAGRIGQAVGRRAIGFGMRLLYTSPSPKPDFERETGAGRAPLETLLKESDVLSLHAPLTTETEGIIGERELGLMKPTALLVNTARGKLVDEDALVDALREGKIRGAGLDVYENEPEVHPGLLELENVVLLPHIGSATTETRDRMALTVANNVVAALAGQTPPDLVNPEAWRSRAAV